MCRRIAFQRLIWRVSSWGRRDQLVAIATLHLVLDDDRLGFGRHGVEPAGAL
jgi:hypothetical protein